MPRRRDYRAEYARRNQAARAKGFRSYSEERKAPTKHRAFTVGRRRRSEAGDEFVDYYDRKTKQWKTIRNPGKIPIYKHVGAVRDRYRKAG